MSKKEKTKMAKTVATKKAKITRKRLWLLGVDSGQLLITDPCYLESKELPVRPQYGPLTLPYSTPGGDGVFPVYEERCEGKIVLVMDQGDRDD
jgi:hypothetical protein